MYNKNIEQNIVDLLIKYSNREYENWLFHKYFQKYVCTKYSSTTLVAGAYTNVELCKRKCVQVQHKPVLVAPILELL